MQGGSGESPRPALWFQQRRGSASALRVVSQSARPAEAQSCTRNAHSCARNAHSCTRNAHSCTRNAHSCARNAQSRTQNAQSCTRNAHSCTRNARSCTRNARSCTGKARPGRAIFEKPGFIEWRFGFGASLLYNHFPCSKCSESDTWDKYSLSRSARQIPSIFFKSLGIKSKQRARHSWHGESCHPSRS